MTAAAAPADVVNTIGSPSPSALPAPAATGAAAPPPSSQLYAPSRRQPPISYPWRSVASLNDLAAAVCHYLDRRALLSSGVPDSLAAETDSLLAALKDMCSMGFATLSSQPGVKDDRTWQRFYVSVMGPENWFNATRNWANKLDFFIVFLQITGVLPKDKASQILAALQARSFITLLSTPETTTIHVSTPEALPPPPESLPLPATTSISNNNSSPSPRPPPARATALPTATPCIPLTVARHAYSWRTVTDIPLPAPLAELMADSTDRHERRNVVMEDDGALFEHHFDVNFGRFGLTKRFRRELMSRTVVVTLVWPVWGETDGPLADVLEAVRQEMRPLRA
ncbi:hypothetical protein HDU86_006040 [Geranomyces michiganensis]|nr:hypothetical protein HDU86_006040 [Geranomyces michiganensis]